LAVGWRDSQSVTLVGTLRAGGPLNLRNRPFIDSECSGRIG
jgi:hypothetical protein